MKKDKQIYLLYVSYVFLFIGILGIYNFKISNTVFFSYDSVKNYQILKELQQGNWQNFFHHASPALFGLYSVFLYISEQPDYLIFMSSIIQVLGVFCWSYLLRKNDFLCLLWIALSFFVVCSSHYFSIEPLGFLLCGVFLVQIKNLIDFITNAPNPLQANLLASEKIIFERLLLKKVVFIGFWAALLLLTNYKAIILFFWVGLFFIFQKEYRQIIFLFFWKIFGRFSLGFGSPILFVMLLGSFAGVRFLQYPAIILYIFGYAGNLKLNTTNTLDIFYYFKYFFFFENPILWVALLLFLVNSFLKKISFSRFETLLIWILVGTWLVMSALPKAPRGLVFIYPIIYYLAYKIILEWIKRLQTKSYQITAQILFLYLPLVYASTHIYTHIYAYNTPTQYSAFAKILEEKKAKVVFTTLGLGIYPFLSNCHLEILRSPADTTKFKDYEGKKYLLYDASATISGQNNLNLDNLLGKKNYTILKTASERSLLNPMLHLEASEYNGLYFEKALQKRRELEELGVQLILVEFL